MALANRPRAESAAVRSLPHASLPAAFRCVRIAPGDPKHESRLMELRVRPLPQDAPQDLGAVLARALTVAIQHAHLFAGQLDTQLGGVGHDSAAYRTDGAGGVAHAVASGNRACRRCGKEKAPGFFGRGPRRASGRSNRHRVGRRQSARETCGHGLRGLGSGSDIDARPTAWVWPGGIVDTLPAYVGAQLLDSHAAVGGPLEVWAPFCRHPALPADDGWRTYAEHSRDSGWPAEVGDEFRHDAMVRHP